ncbi:hypothetical protein P4V58_08420 [Bacillus wiedmannii]|nr:hypothetical protein [Bacillus wiedmannii]
MIPSCSTFKLAVAWASANTSAALPASEAFIPNGVIVSNLLS